VIVTWHPRKGRKREGEPKEEEGKRTSRCSARATRVVLKEADPEPNQEQEGEQRV